MPNWFFVFFVLLFHLPDVTFLSAAVQTLKAFSPCILSPQ